MAISSIPASGVKAPAGPIFRNDSSRHARGLVLWFPRPSPGDSLTNIRDRTRYNHGLFTGHPGGTWGENNIQTDPFHGSRVWHSDGTQDDIVEDVPKTYYGFGGAVPKFIISMWFKHESGGTQSTYQQLMSTEGNWVKFMWWHGASENRSAWEFYTDGWQANQYTTAPLADNTWHHVAAALPSTTDFRIYHNGKFDKTTNPGGSPTAAWDNFDFFSGFTGASPFHGWLFDARVYDLAQMTEDANPRACDAFVKSLYEPATRFDLWKAPRQSMRNYWDASAVAAETNIQFFHQRKVNPIRLM